MNTQSYYIEKLNFIHCLFQELEDKGIDLPIGDYSLIYDMLEDIRDDYEVNRIIQGDLQGQDKDMTYLDYISKTIDELKGFQSLYKVYAPLESKSRGDDIVRRITTILEKHKEMVANDNRPDPF